ncbi:hypothetical protein KNSL1_011791 [Colletotrichum chrysophilum]|nr:hypothetical protein KNSL1_011791 [Colletotrichum chrysophilum]
MNLLIRNLDFIDGHNTFNEATEDDTGAYSYGVAGRHLMRQHRIGDKRITLKIEALDKEMSLQFVDSIKENPVSEGSSDEVSSDEDAYSDDETVYEESFYEASLDADSTNSESVNRLEESTISAKESVKTIQESFSEINKSSNDIGKSVEDSKPPALVNSASLDIRHGASGASYLIQSKSTIPKAGEADSEDQKAYTIILVYRLEYVADDETPAIAPLPTMWENAFETTNRLLTKWKSASVPLSKSADLDFCLRRNLEHILSVCSIPVPKSSGDKISPVALTCGDAESHRVSTAASL